MAKKNFNFKDVDMSTVILIIIIVLVLYFVFSEDRPDPNHKLINYIMDIDVGPKDAQVGIGTKASMNSDSMDASAEINVGDSRLHADAGLHYGENNRYGVGAGLGLDEDELSVSTGYNSNKNDLYFDLEGFENDNNKLKVIQGTCKIVLFHATWCGYCKKFMPHWDQFKKINGSTLNGKKIELVEVESSEKELINENDIQGYPTVKGMRDDGSVVVFEGDRTLEGLKEFANEICS